MTTFVLGIGLAIIAFIFYMKHKTKNLIDKERELMLQLKEQESETSKLEQNYEEAKNNFNKYAAKYQRDSKSNDFSKL